MASINLSTAVRSLTRSILLNTGKKIGHDHNDGDGHEEHASGSISGMTPPLSPTGSLGSMGKIQEIASKIGLHHEESLHDILLKTKSSPMLKNTSSFVKISENDLTKSASNTVFDEADADESADEKDFPYTDGYTAADDYDNVTFTVPSMEHGTVLFK